MEAITKYLQQVKALIAKGNATEHSFRPALINLIEDSAKGVKATNEPKRVKAGAPDLIVTRGQIPLGYIETKDIGKSLDDEEHSEQMKRYRKGLNNLILTDYLEFRWYEGGEKRMAIRLATINDKGKILTEKCASEDFSKLIEQFFTTQIPTVGSPKELAGRMAGLGQIIHDIILKALGDEEKSGSLHGQFEGFRKVLLHDLEESQFADMYAQTICYGLFAARCNHQGRKPFTRESAALDLPETNPFLGEMFDYIAGRRLDKSLIWIVDHLAELLNRADIETILRDFGKRTRREDPVVHFYETFLAAYDPKMREARGVYYTPEPVVSYIVRSIDHILKTDFGLPDGLADTSMVSAYKNVELKDGKIKRIRAGECHKVLILDPAVGTGTFLFGVIDQIHEYVLGKGGKGIWPGYVSKHLLPRLFGFELLMAPYTVAHLKLGLQLKEIGYEFNSGERLRIYLTNTLEEGRQFVDLAIFANMIANEANAASRLKSEAPVMVILGNPPYYYKSENKGKWISGLIRDYYYCDGVPIRERNSKGLQDDYVKFIRFAQNKIDETGYGILAFITNRSYIDNPTFRGMRNNLMKSFDKIFILDLHGGTIEKFDKELKDENIFPTIEQGVAIAIFVKLPKDKSVEKGVFYHDIIGPRGKYPTFNEINPAQYGKYGWLWDNELSTTEWHKLQTDKPSFDFVPRQLDNKEEYNRAISIREIMPENSVGLYTARDPITIHQSRESLNILIKDFCSLKPQEIAEKYKIEDESDDWSIKIAQNDLLNSKMNAMLIKIISYRPFDMRYTYYTGNTNGFICRPRFHIMAHLLRNDNLAICYLRRSREGTASNFFVARSLIDKTILSSADNAYIAPLYLSNYQLIDNALGQNEGVIEVNISTVFSGDLAKQLGWGYNLNKRGDLKTTFGPEDIFHYMYAVFYSPAYRKRYAEFLKIDFPRLPLTSNRDLFRELCGLGEELVGLHLMEKIGPPVAQYPITGNNMVEKVRYSEPGQGAPCGRVWINKDQYFENVPPDVWQFHIGGYQVCEKWLKDRKGRTLSYDDLTHYQHIVSALSETIRLMAEIDMCINQNGGWPIK